MSWLIIEYESDGSELIDDEVRLALAVLELFEDVGEGSLEHWLRPDFRCIRNFCESIISLFQLLASALYLEFFDQPIVVCVIWLVKQRIPAGSYLTGSGLWFLFC